MSFDYGRETLGIRNPFKVQGWLRASRGLIVLVLGGYALTTIQPLVEAGQQAEAWAALVVAIVLTVAGLKGLLGGSYQAMRFFVGRGVPSDLTNAEPRDEEEGRKPPYATEALEEMLLGRKNTTFEEPQGWLERALLSIAPKLLFLPEPYRMLIRRLGHAVAQTVFALLVFAMAWFSSTTGLTTLGDTPVLAWLALFLTIYLFGVWVSARRFRGRVTTAGLSLKLGIAAVTPFGLAYLHGVAPLPALPAAITLSLVVILGLATLLCVLAAAMVWLRARASAPETAVAEYRNNWQEVVHPRELFIHLDAVVMANRRYKEIPNRVYRVADPELIEEGSRSKGSFSGGTLQETQPAFRAIPAPKLFTYVRFLSTAIAQILFIVAALMLWKTPSNLIESFATIGSAGGLIELTALTFPIPLLLIVFGAAIQNCTNLFWAEMHFASLLLLFRCDGTYSESRLSAGSGVYDSTRSENTVVRSSLTPWIIAANAVTSTFTTSGSRSFSHPRYLLELHKAEVELDQIVSELRGFLQNRETIVGVQRRDIESSSAIHQLNQHARNTLGTTDVQLPPQSNRDLIGAEPEAHGETDAAASGADAAGTSSATTTAQTAGGVGEATETEA